MASLEFTLLAKQPFADGGVTAFLGGGPWPIDPGRVVANVLGVTAFEVGYPVAFFVLVETDDLAFEAATHG